MNTLKRISLSGFKSLKEVKDLEFGALNVLIGANGAGKSNLISFFQMLNYAMTGGLRSYVSTRGGASSLLHFGPKRTKSISATVTFATTEGENTYELELTHAAGDALVFTDEAVSFHRQGAPRPTRPQLGVGHQESMLNDAQRRQDPTVRFVRGLLTTTRVYQFHDTTAEARIRNKARVTDDRALFSDGGNVSAVLHRVRAEHPALYRRIVSVIQQVAPFFEDFYLEPEEDNQESIRLRWREKGALDPMGPHQLSDGTIRFIALTTLLNLPPAELPKLIVIDEPELGLHPAAVHLLVEMLRVASTNGHTQVFISTQSVTLINRVHPEEVIVAERIPDGSTEFKRPDPDALAVWLEDFAMGELWEKNVYGGRP